MSAPERASHAASAAAVTLAARPADIVEVSALRDRTHVLKALAARRGMSLPPFGRVASAGESLALCVRPERWLLLTPPAATGVAAASWQQACERIAAVVDLSSALVGLELSGANARQVLARGCRLDLDPEVFPAGHAAATAMAQVPVTVAALATGVLLLTPATTARHFREWLIRAALPLGLAPDLSASVTAASGDRTI